MNFTFEDLLNFTRIDGGAYSIKSFDEALLFCKKITEEHYENFPVASKFLPKNKRKYIYSIYAFARIADDIADYDSIEPQKKIEALNSYEAILNRINEVTDKLTNPIFLALRNSINDLNLPIIIFQKLLIAFKRDSDFSVHDSLESLEKYSDNSANPVGELILRVFGEYDDNKIEFSNNICTGLQLANFWQDFSVDLKNNRLFIPLEILDQYNLSLNDLFAEGNEIEKSELLSELYNYTESLLLSGSQLIRKLKSIRLRFEIALTIEGGLLIVSKCRSMNLKIFENRPKINKLDYIFLALKVILFQRII